MSYPQPLGSKSVNSGQTVFRLNTLISSPGDIYECDVGVYSVMLGPESDLARVRVTYFDPTVPTSNANSFVISPDRSFNGLLSAREDQPYPLASGKAGRILLSVDDIYDPSLEPAGFAPGDTIQFCTPRLDVLGYFQEPPIPTTKRSDGVWRFQFFDRPGGQIAWVAVPYWGRKYAYCEWYNQTGGPIAVNMWGINFSMRQPATAQASMDSLVAAAALADGSVERRIVTASGDGMYDMLLFNVNSAAAIPTLIITSDEPL